VRIEFRIPVLSGRALAFADNLGAGEILPERFAGLTPAAAVRYLFADIDPGLASQVAVGDVLVGGHNLGGGGDPEAAARTLAAAGMVAVVAGSFASGFDQALLAARLPALEVDAPAVFHTGARMRLNLEAGTIANLSSGDRQPIRNLTEPLLDRLRGLLGR
jgi:3-isopropylmalate/(R)-2-methylmalate dehydratase small subunit